MAENLYAYAVARIHARETGLLTGAVYEQLLAAPDYAACLRVLGEKGWEISSEEEPGALLSAEEGKTWALIAEMVDDMSPFDVFLYANDYHNLKAAIKKEATGDSVEPVFVGHGTVDPELLKKAAQSHEFALLPPAMAAAASEAWTVMKQTGDGQLCDMVLDKAALCAIGAAGEQAQNELMARYAELTVAAADIKVAVRCCKMKKNRTFILNALAPCRSLSVTRLAAAAAESPDAVYEYLRLTDYAGAVEALKDSAAAFECWCDDLLMEAIRPEKYATFTIGPLAAYILARQSELKSVRMILAGKRNRLPADAVRARLRKTYMK